MMRAAVIFCLAIALGAITVSGQGVGEENDLKARIRALSEALKQRADARAPDGRPVLQFHELGDLVMRLPESSVDSVNLLQSRYQPPEADMWLEPHSAFDFDYLMEIIRTTIEPATWEEIEGAEIKPLMNRLLITQIPRVQRKIAALLNRLRTATDRRMRVRFVAVVLTAADQALLDRRARELSADEAKELLSREPLGVAETICYSGVGLGQRVGRRVSYLQDYDVKIAQEASIGDPNRHEAFCGMTVELRAMLDEGGDGARINFELTRSNLAEPIRRVDTEHGPLELPDLALTLVKGAMWVPLGKTSIVGGSTSGLNPCLFLVTVDRIR